jgi:flagellar biosynthesis protein FlhF
MRLRTFLAKDMKEALAAMRAELGEESVIVASEKLKDGSVLLRAGIEETGAPAGAAEEAFPRDAREPEGGISHHSSFDARYRESLLARLRGAGAGPPHRAMPFDRARLLEILRAHRTPAPLAQSIVEDAQKSGLPDMILALASALDRSMCSEAVNSADRGAIMLVGPPGAGKTAVAAKLAAQYCLAGSPVLLAATDMDSAGQVARLEGFATCLNLPVLRAPEPGTLCAALREARSTGALLIADTGGCDPRAALSREFLALTSVGNMDIVGVVSAASDAEEAGETAAALAKLGASRLVVTGLDLARRKGALIGLALSGLAITRVTSSPYLADGLETLTPMALSRMVAADAPEPTRRDAPVLPQILG